VYYRSNDYSERLRDYHAAVINSQNELEEIEALSSLQPRIYRTPAVGSILVGGIEDRLSSEITINHRRIPAEFEGSKTQLNQFTGVLRTFDYADVVTILLTLLAFLLSYDAVSGEKERGLLNLTLSNSIPRHRILFGKLFGALLPLIFSLTAGMLVGILILLILPGVQISSDVIIRICLIFLASLIFLSLMLLLGIIVSSVTRHSFISLICLMFLWVLFVFIIPGMSQYTSLQLKTVTSKRNINDQIFQLENELNEKIADYRKTIQPQRTFASMSGGILTIHGNPPETVEYYRQLNAYAIPLQIEYAQHISSVERQQIDDLIKQAKLATFLSAISPTSIYKMISAALAGTDRADYENFLNAARSYRLQIIDYIKSQGGFSSDKYFMQYDYNPTDEELRLSRETTQLFQKMEPLYQQPDSQEELQKLYQRFREIREQISQYYEDFPLEVRKLDLSDMPRFQYTPLDISKDLKRSLWNLGLLIFFNILGFLIAHVSFLRYDVR